MTKRKILDAIIAVLQADLDTFTRAADAARAEATDPQSRAEHKYDTRGLEASYLAAGQARQVKELDAALATYRLLSLRAFGPGEAVDLSALVELEQGGEKTAYFMGPCAGGTEVTVGKRSILVITPQSPLGQLLLGRKAGDRFDLNIAGRPRAVRLVTVA